MPSIDLKVVTYCAYLTDIDIPWRSIDHNCSKMVKALKGSTINGTFSANVAGQQKQFTQSNVSDFVDLIPKKMASIMLSSFNGDYCIVPIPNSSCTSPDDETFNTLKMAEKIGKIAKKEVFPCLTFKENQTPSRKGGPRDPHYFESAYKLHRPLPKTNVILFDDVFTSGSHIQGACWKLNASNINVIGAVCFGRTTKIKEDNPLGVVEHTLSLSKGLFGFEDAF